MGDYNGVASIIGMLHVNDGRCSVTFRHDLNHSGNQYFKSVE